MIIHRILSIVLILTVQFSFAQTRKPTGPPPITKEQAAEVKKEAAAMYKDGRYKDAIAPYTKLVNFDPEDMDFNYKLGMCYVNSNVDKTQAIQYFVKAVDKKDCPKDAYYYMGKSLLVAGLFDEAIDAFDKYKAVNKGAVNPKFNLDQHMEYCY